MPKRAGGEGRQQETFDVFIFYFNKVRKEKEWTSKMTISKMTTEKRKEKRRNYRVD